MSASDYTFAKMRERTAALEAENERLKEELGKAEHMLLRYVLAEIARALGDSGEEVHGETT